MSVTLFLSILFHHYVIGNVNGATWGTFKTLGKYKSIELNNFLIWNICWVSVWWIFVNKTLYWLWFEEIKTQWSNFLFIKALLTSLVLCFQLTPHIDWVVFKALFKIYWDWGYAYLHIIKFILSRLVDHSIFFFHILITTSFLLMWLYTLLRSPSHEFYS